MAATVPALEETKGIILKAKGAAWLKEQEEKFNKTFGKSIPDPAFRMWLIGRQNNIDVGEIKAAADGSEGEPVVIAEMRDRMKGIKEDQGKAHGWTYVNGGTFDQPDEQTKYSLTAVVLSVEEKGTTKKGDPKLDYHITDGTGISKIGANGASVQMMVEAKAKPGSVIRFPLLNVNYGFHNFGKQPNQLWWKFSLPPFDNAAVVPMERDVKDFFLSMERDVVKADMPCYLTGFITHIDARSVEVCSICGQWVTEKKTHDECQAVDGFEVVEKMTWTGTSTSVTGQTNKLNFSSKPNIKVAVDLVEVFGRMNKMNAIDVAFIRKVGADGIAEMASSPAPKAAQKPTPKQKVVEPKYAESEDTEEEDPTPAQKAPYVPPRVVKRPAPKPVPEPEPEEAPEEEVSEEPTEEEMVEEPVVVVTPKRKAPTAAPAAATASSRPTQVKVTPKAVVQQAEAVEVAEIPEAILTHIEKACKQFGGTNQIFVIARTAIRTDVVSGDTEEALMEQMKGYVEQAIESGHLEYADAAKNRVSWVG